jgi:phosphonate dehydrogenase
MTPVKPTVVLTHRVHAEIIDLLQAHCTVVANQEPDTLPATEIRRRAQGAEALMAFMPDSIDAAFLDQCPGLRVIGAALKGHDNFDIAACTARGIWFSVVPDLLTVPTAELAIGLLIGLTRRLLQADAVVRSGRFAGWRPQLYGLGIDGAEIGILGMGAIGRALAERLQGWGARLSYQDRIPLPPAEEARLALRRLEREELLAGSDIVLLALPLNPATLHLIDAEALGRLRPGAFLVNPCRGSVVDEEAVLAALESGRLGGYAADVFEMEDWARPDRPRRIPPGLLAHPDTLFSPHIGSAVQRVRLAIERRAAENIIQGLAGMRPMDAVNEPRRGA